MDDADPLSQRILPAGGWVPRDYQMQAWDYLENGGKRACLVWHRRAGKDELALHRTAVAAHERVATYWHMLPEAAQARKAIWDAVNPHTGRRRIDEIFPVWCRKTTREQEMTIKFLNGSTWQVVGSDNFDSLVGASPAGVVFSEWALADPRAWAFVRPMLLENDGWAIFVTTPRGNNHARKTFDLATSEDHWFGQLLTVADTGVISADALEAERREMHNEHGPEDGEAYFQQEWYCSWAAANPGAVYAHWIQEAEDEGRITEVPIDYRYPVRTTWDLGMRDSTAIWFYQDVGFQTRWLHAYSNNSEDLQHYVEYVSGWCRDHRVQVGPAILPHDVEVRELGTGRSRKEVLQALGLDVRVAPNLRIPEQIQATRDMLKTAWFDKQACALGLDALRFYHFEKNEKTRAFSTKPKHDWSSHYASAIAMKSVSGYDDEAGGYFTVRRAKPLIQPERWI